MSTSSDSQEQMVVDKSNPCESASECDPMAMLLDAKLENIAAFDASQAKKLQQSYGMEEELLKDQKLALMIQAEEDSNHIKSSLQVEEDQRIANETQKREEEAFKVQEEKDRSLAKVEQEREEKELNDLKEQLAKDSEMARRLNDDFLSSVQAMIFRADVEGLKRLISSGFDCSLVTNSQHSPLHLAVKCKQLEICKVLLAHNAQPDCPDADGNTPLHHAAATNKLDFIAVLLDSHAQVNAANRLGHTPLTLAAKAGHSASVELLVKRGAYIYHKDASNRMPLHHVPFLSRSLRARLEAMMGWGLLDAARRGRGDSVMQLLDRGASPLLSDERDRTALHHAAAAGHGLVAEHLLQRNADPNAPDLGGETPLHRAAAAGSAAVCAALLRHGGRPVPDARGRLPSQLCSHAGTQKLLEQAEASSAAAALLSAAGEGGGGTGGPGGDEPPPPRAAS